MSDARFLLRFDDLCPTMNWAMWDAIEAHLVRMEVRPILAVVPDNRDPKLVAGPPRADFWDRVRRWQGMGWAIALHGCQHVYVNRNPGMIGLNPQSEFAGLARSVQERKLTVGLGIFREQGVRADAWVAPAHSFDRTTVELLVELGVPVISDGLWRWPFRRRGMIWVPQQVWDFCPRPPGVWTVCLHPNAWSRTDLEAFIAHLETYAARMTDLAAVVDRYGTRAPTLGDHLTAGYASAWTHGLRPRLVRAVTTGTRMERRPA
jgi:predicted deacetylase